MITYYITAVEVPTFGLIFFILLFFEKTVSAVWAISLKWCVGIIPIPYNMKNRRGPTRVCKLWYLNARLEFLPSGNLSFVYIRCSPRCPGVEQEDVRWRRQVSVNDNRPPPRSIRGRGKRKHGRKKTHITCSTLTMGVIILLLLFVCAYIDCI